MDCVYWLWLATFYVVILEQSLFIYEYSVLDGLFTYWNWNTTRFQNPGFAKNKRVRQSYANFFLDYYSCLITPAAGYNQICN